MRLPARGSINRGTSTGPSPAEGDHEAANHAPPPYHQAASNPNADTTASLQLHPLPSKDALIVQVRPPIAPVGTGSGVGVGAADTAAGTLNRPPRHVPCDIVLVIDVSGSMGIRADVPGEEPSESPGLSVLDLTKHAALTILETLDDRDRLGIVTFSSKSQVVQRLLPMTLANKEASRRNIKYIKKQDATNLWHGLLDGIRLFKQANEEDEAGAEAGAPPSDRVPALMVLTDGKPNFMCPPAGYVPKLRAMLPLPASIHTFGFGYHLESGLLKSIAEIGGGNYAFIPDAGMIGTVFVHAVANLQSTFATDAVLELSYPRTLRLAETMNEYVGQQQPREALDGSWRLTMKLGNLQYGQSRDIYLRVEHDSQPGEGERSDKEQALSSSAVVAAQLSYKQSASRTTDMTLTQRSMLDASSLPDAEVAYHESRALICRYLASLFPLNVLEVHRDVDEDDLPLKRDELTLLIDSLPARRYKDSDAANRSLVEDLEGPEPRGQISIAVRNNSYFRRWGVHYLPSLLNAHARQVCNSFKDQGPLQYGARSPLFVECRDRLDNAFDNLPAPEPSLPPRPQAYSASQINQFKHSGGGGGGGGGTLPAIAASAHRPRAPFSMSRYHNPSGVCFAGSTPVELASSLSTLGLKRHIPMRTVRRGMAVLTPLGPRRVVAVLKTRVQGETLCRIPGGVLVTPWHPISAGAAGKDGWVFPAQVAVGVVRYTGYVYSVLLQRDGEARAHALRVGGNGAGGTWGTTLGHGVTGANDDDDDDDVRAHEFFGDYGRVVEALQRLGMKKNGIAVGRGVIRDEETGLVTGFRSQHDD